MNVIDYPNLVLGALRHAIAGLLREVAEEGLPGDHHFYITFRTDAPGVEIPSSLHRDYPDELTIVLQHQFWDFSADAEGFAVTLRFGGTPAQLRVPYAAMTAFADPSVEFGVQLAPPKAPLEVVAAEEVPSGPKAAPSGTVIAFDKNRKRD
jgi:uncharacterized protein